MQNEVNLDRFHNRIRKVCPLVAATLIFPALAYAQAPPSIPTEIAALQAQVAALQKQVNTLTQYITVVQGEVNGVKGPHIYFTGANIHIVSGSTVSRDNTGLGNLII